MKRQLMTIVVLFLPFIFYNALAQANEKQKAMDELFKAYNAGSGEVLDMRILQNAFNHEVLTRSIKGLQADNVFPSYGEGYIDVYEFSDYQCTFCRKMYSVLRKYSDLGRIRVHVIVLPLFGEDSQVAAEYALAAHDQGKFDVFHQVLMETNRHPTLEVIQDAMNKTNIDVKRAEQFIKNDKVSKLIDTSYSLATLLRVDGTPTMVINGEIFYGALPEEEFLSALNELH